MVSINYVLWDTNLWCMLCYVNGKATLLMHDYNI